MASMTVRWRSSIPTFVARLSTVSECVPTMGMEPADRPGPVGGLEAGGTWDPELDPIPGPSEGAAFVGPAAAVGAA